MSHRATETILVFYDLSYDFDFLVEQRGGVDGSVQSLNRKLAECIKKIIDMLTYSCKD